MKSLVVFFALAAVACASVVPLAQPAYHAALFLDPHGRPLDNAEVINARAIHLQAKALEPHSAFVAQAVVAPVAYAAAPVFAAPSAVSHQSRVDVRTSPAIVTAHAAPVIAAHSAYAAPLLGHSALGFAGHGHLLKKRSLGHYAYAAPVIATAPAAVSHQSRVDVVSTPAVVSHAVAAPVFAHAALAPVVAHAVAPAAVSHQSRVDVRTSPAVFSHSVVAAPILSTPILGAHSSLALSGHGQLLKKRSLAHFASPIAIAHAPTGFSHQSRIDVVSRPAVVTQAVSAYAPVAVAHAAPAVVAHVAPIVSLAHSAVRTASASHLLHSAPLTHVAHW